MTALTRKNAKFVWIEQCERSFQELKTRLTTTLVLTIPSGTEGYLIYTDASGQGLGTVLMQHGKVIAYAFRQLKNYKKNYSTKANKVADALSRQLMAYVMKVREIPLELEDQTRGEDMRSRFHILEDGVLGFKGRIYVSDDAEIKKQIFYKAHNAPYAMHPPAPKNVSGFKEIFLVGEDEKGSSRIRGSFPHLPTNQGGALVTSRVAATAKDSRMEVGNDHNGFCYWTAKYS
ncbi:uncharacterized protein LOC133805641 [Humulus lupulus]|uniref:uncharacterized protein LOC133805641 n=1 Tax=Humulus lupulus TaxID=3486 RepID=UPI002B41231E|nr:uncharacterized protein LOC133805641 [Humulus lupulus]